MRQKGHNEKPSPERNSGSVFLWTGQARSLESLKQHLHRTNSHLSRDSPHLSMAETFYPIEPGTQVDRSQFDYTTAVSASECLLSGGKVEGGDLRREEQEDPPVSRQEERWRPWSAATQECRLVCTLAKRIHQFAYPSTKGITMGGTISQKKGSRRASSRSHTSSVMWVKFLTCWMLT